MIWIIAFAIVAYIGYRFFSDLNKDNYDLGGKPLHEKFAVITQYFNQAVFNDMGKITTIDKRRFNLYQDGQNQIIMFNYSTGHLTITWKYKFYQKEVVHEKTFNDVRNLSIFEQQKIADIMMNETAQIIQRHQNNVLNF